jgi:hypothetical protein
MPLDPDILVIRINEFANQENISFLDEMLIWSEIDNQTKYVTLQQLYAFIGTNGNAPLLNSIIEGGKLIYDVTQADDGLDDYINPALAGQDFTLTKEGRPMLKQIFVNGLGTVQGAEYEVLNSGGFHLLGGDKLTFGSRFELTLFEKIQGGQGQGGNGNNAPAILFKRKKQISANTVLVWANDGGKIIQIRGEDVQIVTTLPKIEDVDENAVIVIETAINNTVQQRITTQSNQKIYMNNKSLSSIYLGVGETVWLYRDTDGYYVINEFAAIYKNLARPYAAYSYELDENQLLCNGQILQRSQYPRLWEKVQRFAASLVDDNTWLLESQQSSDGSIAVINPFRGCWSSGDGATTFRVPDLMGAFLRGLNTEFGFDGGRAQNMPGAREMDLIKDFTADGFNRLMRVDGQGTIKDAIDAVNATGKETNITLSGPVVGIGPETRPINTAVLWVVNY